MLSKSIAPTKIKLNFLRMLMLTPTRTRIAMVAKVKSVIKVIIINTKTNQEKMEAKSLLASTKNHQSYINIIKTSNVASS